MMSAPTPLFSADPEMYRAAFDASPSSMAILDEGGRILAVNQTWERFSVDNGGESGAYIGDNYLEIVPTGGDVVLDQIHRRLARLIHGQDNSMQLEYPCHSPGRKRWFLMRARRFKSGVRSLILVTHTDITARYLAEERARESANTDTLTGLFNRRSLQERAGQVLAQAKRERGSVALLFIDLDDFKQINDRLGHAVGDAVLIEFSRRLVMALREADVAARIGGDEFVVCCRIENRKCLNSLVERLLSCLSAPMKVQSESIRPTFSMGIALWPDDADQLDGLISAADQAMYQAKAGSGSRVAFASHMDGGRNAEPGKLMRFGTVSSARQRRSGP